MDENAVREEKEKPSGWWVLAWVAAGGALGALVAAIIGYSAGEDCASSDLLCFNRSDTAFLFAIFFGAPIGLFVGLFAGRFGGADLDVGRSPLRR